MVALNCALFLLIKCERFEYTYLRCGLANCEVSSCGCVSIHFRKAADSFRQDRAGVSCAELSTRDIHQCQRSVTDRAA